jgi:hypothetical protein
MLPSFLNSADRFFVGEKAVGEHRQTQQTQKEHGNFQNGEHRAQTMHTFARQKIATNSPAANC